MQWSAGSGMLATVTSVNQKVGKHCSGILHVVPGKASDSGTGPLCCATYT